MPGNSENIGKGCATVANFAISFIVLIILVSLLMPGLIKLPKWADNIKDLRLLETRHAYVKPTLFQNQADNALTHLLIPNLRLKDISTKKAIGKLKKERPLTVWLSYKKNNADEALWESPLQNCYVHNIDNVKILADRLNVYATDANFVKAFQKIDGKMLWEQRMVDYIDADCEDCFILNNDKVIALTKDRVLQALDVSNGKTLWRVRLHNPKKQTIGLRLIGAHTLALIDQTDNSPNSPKGLFFYDTRRGEKIGRILFQTPNLSTPVLFAQKEIFILEKIDKKTVLIAYNTDLKETARVILPSYFNPKQNLDIEKWWRLVDGIFYFIYKNNEGEDAILKLNFLSKEMTKLYEGVDYNIEFLETSPRLLILKVLKKRGTSKAELWQINPRGTIQWQYELSFLSTNEGIVYQTYLWKQYLVLLEHKNTDIYTLNYIRLSSGKSEKVFNYNLKVDEWRYAFLAKDELFVGVRNLYKINLNTGEVEVAFD